jgi:hypothetical protein
MNVRAYPWYDLNTDQAVTCLSFPVGRAERGESMGQEVVTYRISKDPERGS